MHTSAWLRVPTILAWGLGFFLFGLLLRWPLQGVMGTKLIWLTFYPAIMLASLTGGLWSGLFTALCSSSFAIWGWPILGTAPYVKDMADWLGVGVFLMNSLMIALVAEAMRRAREKSKKAQHEAEEANRAKSVFLAQMSHELRTPFNALLGFTNLLVHDPETSPKQKSTLVVIQRSATHLLELINNVLDMSRLESQSEIAESRPLHLRELVGDVEQLLAYRAQQKGLELVVTIDPALPRIILGDAAKIRQILVNLAGNAIKFSPRGSIGITVSPATQEPGSSWMAITVCDQGIGIAPEFLESIFEPFHQIDTSGQVEGSGLGLTITRQFALSMGGRVTVSSTPGKGSCFTAIIPAPVAPDTQDLERKAEDQGLDLVPDEASRDRLFLIVDDHADNRLLMETLHRRLGQISMAVQDGVQAVEAFKKYRPQLIWMDIRMPVLDGIQAMKQIRGLPGGQDLPIIAVTASAFNDEKAQLMAQGFSEVLYKPFVLSQIPLLMTQFLGLQFYQPQPVTSPPDTQPPARDDWISRLDAQERRNLAFALESLDPERIEALVAILEQKHPALGEELHSRMERMDYTGLLARLEKTPQGGSPV